MLAVLWTSWAHGTERRKLSGVSAGWVAYYAAVYRVPVELVEAIIEVESGWEPKRSVSQGRRRAYATHA